MEGYVTEGQRQQRKLDEEMKEALMNIDDRQTLKEMLVKTGFLIGQTGKEFYLQKYPARYLDKPEEFGTWKGVDFRKNGRFLLLPARFLEKLDLHEKRYEQINQKVRKELEAMELK